MAAALLLCGSACDRAWDAVNAGAFSRYLDVLVSHTGATVKPAGCAMQAGTRAGSCEISGDPAAVARFVSALGPEATPADVVFGAICPANPAFGKPDGAGHSPLPGVRLYRVRGPLPPNRENVRFVRVWVSPSGDRACLELEFPYG
jgi:hypothetical protein